MSKDSKTFCLYGGLCNRGRSYNQSCARCNNYKPRAKERHINRKKQELEKIRKNERY